MSLSILAGHVATLAIMTTCSPVFEGEQCQSDSEVLSYALCQTTQRMVPGIEGLMRLELMAEGKVPEGTAPKDIVQVTALCLPLTF